MVGTQCCGPWLTSCGQHVVSEAKMPTYLKGRAKSERSTGLEGWKMKANQWQDSRRHRWGARARGHVAGAAGAKDMGRRCKYAERNHRNEDEWLQVTPLY